MNALRVMVMSMLVNDLRYKLIIDVDGNVTAQIVNKDNQIISDDIKTVFDALQLEGVKSMVRKDNLGKLNPEGDFLVISTTL